MVEPCIEEGYNCVNLAWVKIFGGVGVEASSAVALASDVELETIGWSESKGV